MNTFRYNFKKSTLW